MLDKRGFTLIELLVTITVLMTISAVVITSAVIARKNSDDSKRKADLKNLQLALQQYSADLGHYPLCMDLDSLTAITNCTGLYIDSSNKCINNNSSNSCVPTKTYLNTIPHDPYDNGVDIRYCYAAYTQYMAAVSPGSTCNDPINNPTGDPTKCQYYKLYSPLSDDPLTRITCHEHRGDYTRMHFVTDPSGQGIL